jgi:hypothetical protein
MAGVNASGSFGDGVGPVPLAGREAVAAQS